MGMLLPGLEALGPVTGMAHVVGAGGVPVGANAACLPAPSASDYSPG